MASTLGKHKNIIALLLVGLIAHSVFAIIPPLNGDEATHWEWSRHLDWGYYDHPPMTAWSIALVTSVFGQSQYAVRLTAILLHLGTVIVLYRLVWEIFRNKQLAFLTCSLYMLLPISVFLGTAIGTDCALIFFFTATVYLVKRAIIDDEKRFWYFAGITSGGMLLSKFMAVLFFPGIFLFLILTPRYRNQLLSKEPYLATLLSLIILSPFLYWNFNNQWLTFQFNFVIRQQDSGFAWEKPLYYFAGQMLAASPVFLIMMVIATVFFIFRKKKAGKMCGAEDKSSDTLRLVAYLTAFPLAYYLGISFTVEIAAHWTGIIYPTGTLLLTAWLYTDDSRRIQGSLQRKKSFQLSVFSLIVVSGAIIVILTFPKLLPDKMLYTEKVYAKAPVGSHYFGWKEVGLRIDELITELEAGSDDLFFSSSDYSLAAMLGFYTPSQPHFFLMNVDDKVVFGKTILLWSKGKKRLGADTLYVTDSPVLYKKQVKPFFKTTRQLEPLVVRDSDNRILRVFYFTLGQDYIGGEPDVLSIW